MYRKYEKASFLPMWRKCYSATAGCLLSLDLHWLPTVIIQGKQFVRERCTAIFVASNKFATMLTNCCFSLVLLSRIWSSLTFLYQFLCNNALIVSFIIVIEQLTSWGFVTIGKYQSLGFSNGSFTNFVKVKIFQSH